MSRQQIIGSRAFLKKQGFAIGKTPHEIDKLLLRSLTPTQRENLKQIWSMRDMGYSNGLEQYSVPETARQAALLFSYDWPRMVASLDWFGQVVSLLGASSVIEMGSGPGYLLKFLGDRHPALRLQGIDLEENLIKIGSGICGRDHIVGDYRDSEPDSSYDMIICNFGFDLARFSPSATPHSEARCGAASYCPGCSEDLRMQLISYMKAWRRWGDANASLAVTGRIPGFGELRAFVLAAEEMGWALDLRNSEILRVKDIQGEPERFPALVFRLASDLGQIYTLEDVAGFYCMK